MAGVSGERWNRVLPTYGVFWGLGIGLGCGVGWGPGFGLETVGLVGGGCGLGFSVGLTFIGFGIGLPANGLTCLPHNALTCITNETFNLARGAAHLAAFSSSVISGIKGSWLAMGIALRDLDLRFRNPSSQPLKPINSKGQEKSV
ncbi:hypothetical protein KP509_34G036900 [Ceratopteris richardii]|uniref:Uncharacterized protein n=1 Tax=Ceratopteris richardii TaxID=49495 RepID=A0A8T2QJR4_CERRI|nr:hypothetical protein KP509_34G036900 [Ceratopteris richardii]